MTTRPFLPGFCLAVAALSSAGDPPVVDWIRSQAIRIDTPEAGHGFADLQPLKNVIGDVRIVALGEATHGTREFFQLKHRLVEFLAAEMGFTIFSIEANMPEAYRLNDYVLHGRGDPKQLLKGLYFWTWDTQEVLDMILWMRQFNESGKGRLEFTGFDMQTPTVAMEIVREFVAKVDPEYAAVVRQAAGEVARLDPQSAAGNFAVATGRFPVSVAAGKRVRYSGYIRTEGVSRGFAGLWWRVDGASGVLAFDNMQNRGVTGTTGWKRYEITLPVSAKARNINFGALLTGDGTAWFDGLAVELNGKEYAAPGLDLDFEQGARGFYTGGNGYEVRPDDAVSHTGAHSLRLQYVGAPAPSPSPAGPETAAAAWSGVVRHLEESREAYRNNAAEPDIDWAIQNARIVVQAMQMRAEETTRDESMARNIQWILRRSPKAKIVLWAHNGHVGAVRTGGYRSMGAILRDAFPKEMAIFGFAFDQGSFQAVEPGRGLHDFTLAPAPAGSLDATLAAAGVPLFALDLRRVPARGPVAEWWGEPHLSRSIGALFSDGTASQYLSPLKAPEVYDALLFVGKTTAARKN
jgi:erythromycin esterase-like protein